ncbi:MAG TPA: RNA polymerase sigma factor [Terriglobales bacterium]|nr:RNA polymerase sigma factor [Terriglobales bacterium]
MRELALSLTFARPAPDAEVGAVPVGEENFRAFYEETARPLLAYLTRVSSSAETAGDLFQETYFHWLRARNLPLDGVIRRKYLFRIATNLLRDSWRRSKREAGSEVATEPAVECDRELSCNLHSAFDQLKPREREMLWLAYVEEYDHREIAAITGVRFGSVRMLLFRARHKLAELVRGGNEMRAGKAKSL